MNYNNLTKVYKPKLGTQVCKCMKFQQTIISYELMQRVRRNLLQSSVTTTAKTIMARDITSFSNVGMKNKRRGLNSFSLAPGRLQFRTKTGKAAIEEGYFRATEESEEWDTTSSDDSAIESDSRPSTATSIFTSAGENIPNVGIFAGKARALANCCSSPFDRGGKAFKNDIDIIANLNSGNRNSIARGKDGNFKNLEVEVEQQKDNYKHLGNNIDWSKLPNKPKTLEELQKLIKSKEYNNVLNVCDESETLRRKIEVDLNNLTNENLEHSSKLLNEVETLQDVEDPSDDAKFFEPTATSSPKKKIYDLINSPIKKIQVQPKIYDFPDEENFHLGSTPTLTKNFGDHKLTSDPAPKGKTKMIDSDKLTSEPAPKGKESPKTALKRKKLERYRRKMAKVPICDIIKLCQTMHPF